MENTNVIEGTALPATNLSLGGMLRIPAVRQIMLLIGVAAAVAIGFAIVLWSQTPGYTQLYGDMSAAESADIADALRAADIEYKINASTGDILVPDTSLHDARMQLAASGLPAGGSGMDMMQDQSSFGVSQFMETARYQHALEAELGETISTLGAVRDARVHLAMPKQSSFIRDQKATSASVLLTLFRGRTLESDQATAVVNLVAASVPNLNAEDVTVVDQFGTLLSSMGGDFADGQANNQFKYTRRLEDAYRQRIEGMLTPILGAGRVRAQVAADIDFTYMEETRESFDPNSVVVRSEQISEEEALAEGFESGGVPGALSNQPPDAAGADAAEFASEDESAVQNSSRSSTRNYEVDRTISHTRPQSGRIRRLSVAVLIDENPVVAADTANGAVAETLTDADVERLTSLVREAVGFDETRGDSVVVMKEAFHRVEAAEPVEAPAMWENPMLQNILKQVLGAIIVLAIAFGIVRPMLRNVVAAAPVTQLTGEYIGAGGMPVAAGGGAAMASGAAATPLAPPSYDEKVAAAKNITGTDPARVAQVVKQWVATGG